ncbi:TolC family protein [Chloroherpeton thalassium]|nr:TolC family protein [Chloroherpeton thalassium]
MKHFFTSILTLFIAGSLFAQERIQLSADQAIELALKNNFSLKAEQAESEAVSARTLSVISPEKTELTFYKEKTPYELPGEAQEIKRLQIAQSFEFPLTTYFRAGAQHALSDAAAFRVIEQKTRVAAAVRKAYAEVLFSRSQAVLLRENLALLQDFAKKSARLAEVGETSPLEALRAKSELAKAENLLEEANAQNGAAENNLCTLLALPLGATLQLTDTLRCDFPVFQIAGLHEIAQSGRGALQSAKQEWLAESRTAQAAWSEVLPEIRLAYFWQSFSPALEPDRTFTGGEITLSLPVWFWFGDRGNIQEKAALSEAAKYAFEDAKRQLETEVRNAALHYTAAVSQLENARKTYLPFAQQAFHAAQKAFAAGSIGYLEFLDSKQAYYEAKLHELEKRLAAESALAELFQAIGKI